MTTDSASEEGKVVTLGGRSRWARYAVLGAVCALVVGVYAWSAHSGLMEWSGLSAKNTYYNLLVQGFRAGQLNLKTEPPPGLVQLADPFDPKASDRYRWIYGHPLHDVSYYKGKLYLYWGITPALVLFWPYAALTGHYLLHKEATMIFFSAGFLAGAGVLLAAWRRYFAEVSIWMVASGIMALGLANFAPAILSKAEVYEVAISCGYALTMLALAGIWAALHQPQRCGRWLAAASLAYGLAVGARPSLLFGAVILLLPVVQAWREKRRVRPLLLAATIPIVIIGLGLMLYNALRFDNPLEFGQRYQLPLWPHPEGPHEFDLRYFWFNFRVGFLEPARWSGPFPFVNDIAVPSSPNGDIRAEHSFGVLTNIPLVWLALAVPLAWRSRSVAAHSVLRWFLGAVILLFGTCALTLCLYCAMCLRYEVEFTHTLVLLAVIGFFGLERTLASQPFWRRAVCCGWGLLLTFSVVFNLLEGFALQAETCVNIGGFLLHKGKVDEAILQYQKALAIKPGYAQAFYNLGGALLQKGRADEAIAQYQKALEFKPDYAEARNNLGAVLLQMGRVDEAARLFQQVIQLMPATALSYDNLGKARLLQGKPDEARALFLKAVTLDPGFEEAHYHLANACIRTGKTAEGIAELKTALRLQPNHIEAQKDLAVTLLATGKAEEAIPYCEALVAADPEDARAHFTLGSACLAGKRPEQALTHYQAAARLAPDAPQCLNILAWIYATSPKTELQHSAEAVRLATRACEITKRQNTQMLDTLAAAYAAAGQFDAAIKTTEECRALAVSANDTNEVDTVRQRLELYKAGKPYRDEQ